MTCGSAAGSFSILRLEHRRLGHSSGVDRQLAHCMNPSWSYLKSKSQLMCKNTCTHALIYYLYSMNHPTFQLSRFRNHILDVPGFKQVFFLKIPSPSQFPSQFWPRVAALCHFFTFSVFNSYLQTKLKTDFSVFTYIFVNWCCFVPRNDLGNSSKPRLHWLTLAQDTFDPRCPALSEMKNPPLHTLGVWLVKRLAPL